MKKKRDCFKVTVVISALLAYGLVALACAPAKVRIYPKEAQTEKASPAKPLLKTPLPRGLQR